jgi:hypothetical protein
MRQDAPKNSRPSRKNDPPLTHRSITGYPQALPCNRPAHRIILYSPRRTTQDVVVKTDSPDRQIAPATVQKSREVRKTREGVDAAGTDFGEHKLLCSSCWAKNWKKTD